MKQTSVRKQDANRLLRRGLRDWRDQEQVPFFCECADESCYAAVWLTGSEYDRDSADANWIALAGSHDGAAR
jgi:hypothetical protein